MPEKHLQTYTELGLAISCLRRRRGLTRQQLADKIHKSRTYISSIEAVGSHTGLHLDTVFDIADALDVPVGELFRFCDRAHLF